MPLASPAERRQPSTHPESDAAWQLIRDDAFDRMLTDAELDRWIADHAATSLEPHAELMRVMLGMTLSESEARALYTRVIDHRRALMRALGRPVHVRVAALDLITARAEGPRRRESRPIMVAPALLERALEEAGADAITNLPRGGHFMNLLEHELRQRSRRIAVVFIDLDGFKRVNDEHGHAAGDDILRTMATAARSVLRRGDVLARIGGDEFALMLVDVAPEEPRVIVDRLRAQFEELTAPFATSFSAGIALADEESTGSELLGQADAAMYEEKRKRAER